MSCIYCHLFADAKVHLGHCRKRECDRALLSLIEASVLDTYVMFTVYYLAFTTNCATISLRIVMHCMSACDCMTHSRHSIMQQSHEIVVCLYL